MDLCWRRDQIVSNASADHQHEARQQEPQLFPAQMLPLRVFEPRYRTLVTECIRDDEGFGVVLIERGSEVGGGDVRTAVGTVARIVHAQPYPDGRWSINSTGNPGLASGGTGDVLAGMIGALLCQGLDAERALQYAVCLHGAAADALVARGKGPIGLTASEIVMEARRLLNVWTAR